MTWRGRIRHGRKKQLAMSASLPDVSGAGLQVPPPLPPPPQPQLLSSPAKTTDVKYKSVDTFWSGVLIKDHGEGWQVILHFFLLFVLSVSCSLSPSPPPPSYLFCSPLSSLSLSFSFSIDDSWADNVDPSTGSIFYLDTPSAPPPPHHGESPQPPHSSSSSSLSSICDLPLHSLPIYLSHGSPNLSDRSVKLHSQTIPFSGDSGMGMRPSTVDLVSSILALNV